MELARRFASRFKLNSPLGTALAWLLSLAIFSVLLLFWELAATHAWIKTLFFPAPSVIGASLSEWLETGKLWEMLSPSLQRLYSGLFLGSLFGIATGILIGRILFLYALFDPFVNFLQALPKIAILPIFFIFFGYGDTARIAVIAISAFFPLLVNTSLAVREINPTYFAVAKVYKASRWQRIRQIILPSVFPYILAGLRIAFNTAFVVALSLEIAAAPDGLGQTIWRSWQSFRIEDVYASLFVIGLLSIINNALLSLVEKLLTPWK
jgi:ABC-type nitrate/sulfonate/bicarbonate transport system permease component